MNFVTKGLDTKDNFCGKNSVYCEWNGNEIMYHVSTFLPQNEENDVSKKRYIGNDIIMIVFQEGETQIDLSTVKTEFTRKFHF